MVFRRNMGPYPRPDEGTTELSRPKAAALRGQVDRAVEALTAAPT